MWSLGVRSVMFSAFPDFVEQIPAATFCSAMQIVSEATGFAPGWPYECPQLGL